MTKDDASLEALPSKEETSTRFRSCCWKAHTGSQIAEYLSW